MSQPVAAAAIVHAWGNLRSYRAAPGGHVQDLEALAREAQGGNRGAFSLLYEAMFDRVYRYILVRVGSAADAEDLAQEVFLRAMRALPSYQFRGRPFAAWLFRIAHNTVVDRHRQRGGVVNVSLDDAEPVVSSEDLPQETLLNLDLEQVGKAMSRITDLQREVIRCRFIAELSLAETAEVMDKDVNAIKALQHAALKSLRRELERQPGGMKQERR